VLDKVQFFTTINTRNTLIKAKSWLRGPRNFQRNSAVRSCPILCLQVAKQCCQMLVKTTAQSLHKTSPKSAKKLQTSRNYSPKFAIKPAICSESNHHYLIVVAVFVQHTTDRFYKATSNIQNNNR